MIDNIINYIDDIFRVGVVDGGNVGGGY